MANGVYGTKKPALITANDVDMYYNYRPTRDSESADFTSFRKLDSSLLENSYFSDGEKDEVLPGMYDLRLPLEQFKEAGIYTIYIKPKEEIAHIIAVSTLATDPTVRGIVLRATSEKFNNGNLVGYRVEYFNEEDDTVRNGDFRIITSNNRCEPVTQNYNDALQGGVRYIFNDSSDLVFCTLTPSIAMSYKSSSLPYIGKTNEKIALINTKFNPVCIEVEITEHDIESISTMLEGKQTRNLDNGIITTFDKDGGIYHQAVYGNITNPDEGINHDFKIPMRNNIIAKEEDNLKKIEDNLN